MMTFTDIKHNTLRPQKEKKLLTFFTALITAAVIFVPYMLLSEGYFVFYGDFNVQQIPFYKLCHDAILNGNIKWSFNTDLGANFIGSYSFYLLGSPFFYLTLLFPSSFVPYLMGPLLILKFALAALTGYIYIRRFTRTPLAASLGGLLYAFSGFSVYNIFFNHFHEAIIVFPLLLYALELFITENRRGVFALTVCLCAVVNYFFFFGMVVFCIIYFLVRVCSKAVRIRFTRFLWLVFEAVLGLLLSSALLLPSIYAIVGNSRVSEFLLGWSGIVYGKEQIYLNVLECFFFPPDNPARPIFFPGANVKWSSLGGWLPVFSTTGFFTLFIYKKGDWKKRLLGICLFMALVPILNSAFYAFNSAYYARWFYMPILILCLATVSLLEDSSVDFTAGFKWTAAITVAFALVIGLFPKKTDSGELAFGLYTYDKEHTYAIRFCISVAIACISLAVLYFLLKIKKSNKKAFFKSSIAFVCVISAVYASIFIAIGRSHSYDIKPDVIDRLIEGNVDLNDDTEFRIDVYDGLDNTGMFLGYPTINAFHSVVPSSIVDFYESIGVERGVGSRPDTDVAAIRPLLSVKYLLNRTTGEKFVNEDGVAEMSGYTYKDTAGGYYVYQNDNYIPYGFSYDYYISREDFEGYTENNRANLLLKAMVLDDEQIKKYSGIMKNFSDIREYYDYTDFDTEPINETENETADTEDMGVRLVFSDEEMAADSKRLAKTSAKSFVADNNGFSASVTRDKESLVFFSVPYDEGFTATVNGKPAEIEKVNVGFMAVKVPVGLSDIRFDYETPGLADGIKITVGAAAVLVIYCIICLIFVKRKTSAGDFPEGESLLTSWRKDDLAEAASETVVTKEIETHDILDDFPDLADISENTEKGNFDGGFKIDGSSFK